MFSSLQMKHVCIFFYLCNVDLIGGMTKMFMNCVNVNEKFLGEQIGYGEE